LNGQFIKTKILKWNTSLHREVEGGRMNLTRYEQEVVINLNADEEMATVYSANPTWIRKMDALVREFPDVFRIKRWTEISKTYEMPKKYVRIGKPRELSSEQRNNLEKMRDIKKKGSNKAF